MLFLILLLLLLLLSGDSCGSRGTRLSSASLIMILVKECLIYLQLNLQLFHSIPYFSIIKIVGRQAERKERDEMKDKVRLR